MLMIAIWTRVRGATDWLAKRTNSSNLDPLRTRCALTGVCPAGSKNVMTTVLALHPKSRTVRKTFQPRNTMYTGVPPFGLLETPGACGSLMDNKD